MDLVANKRTLARQRVPCALICPSRHHSPFMSLYNCIISTITWYDLPSYPYCPPSLWLIVLYYVRPLLPSYSGRLSRPAPSLDLTYSRCLLCCRCLVHCLQLPRLLLRPTPSTYSVVAPSIIVRFMDLSFLYCLLYILAFGIFPLAVDPLLSSREKW